MESTLRLTLVLLPPIIPTTPPYLASILSSTGTTHREIPRGMTVPRRHLCLRPLGPSQWTCMKRITLPQGAAPNVLG